MTSTPFARATASSVCNPGSTATQRGRTLRRACSVVEVHDQQNGLRRVELDSRLDLPVLGAPARSPIRRRSSDVRRPIGRLPASAAVTQRQQNCAKSPPARVRLGMNAMRDIPASQVRGT